MTVKNLKGVTAASDQLMKAFKDGNEESFSAAMVSLSKEIQDKILEEATAKNQDQLVLMNRGQRVLTTQETKFYNEVGFGSCIAATTRLTPAAISASQHGGVRPWWLQGSRVT